MSDNLKDELQGMAALHVTLARMDGRDIDKKAARFAAMADYMMLVGSCSKPFSERAARSALNDAALSACRGDQMHVEGVPIDAGAYGWMAAEMERAA